MNAVRVSIFINEADKWRHGPLHLEVLKELAHQGIAGATVVRGVAGYTRSRGISTTSLVDAGGTLPLVVEFIDEEHHVERILPAIKPMVGNRLITTSPVTIRHGGAFQEPA
jgi:PII-like signaling protein